VNFSGFAAVAGLVAGCLMLTVEANASEDVRIDDVDVLVDPLGLLDPGALEGGGDTNLAPFAPKPPPTVYDGAHIAVAQ
jgi:hypothetical protein